jgi:hypothetical protein
MSPPSNRYWKSRGSYPCGDICCARSFAHHEQRASRLNFEARTFIVPLDRSAATIIDPRELIGVALPMKSKALWQRLGFLADPVRWQWPEDVRNELRAAIPKSQRSVFGAAERRQDDIGYVSDWGLFVNMKEQDLLSDVPNLHSR